MKKSLLLLLAVFVIAGATYCFYGADLQGSFPGSSSLTVKKPDLDMGGITVDDAGTLTIEMKNVGTKDVTISSGVTSVYIDDLTTASSDYAWSTLSDTNFLKAGGSTILSPAVLSEGTYIVRACVDSTSKVTESDETNNCNIVELAVGDYLSVADDYDPLEGTGVGSLDEADVSVDSGGVTDGSSDVREGYGSLVWSDTADAPVTAQCFLLQPRFATGTLNGYDYLSFWIKSTQIDTKLSDFGVYLGVDDACSIGGDSGEQIVDLGAPGVTYDGASVSSDQVVSASAGAWHLISIPIPAATDSNNYVGIVLTAPSTFGKGDAVWFDDFSLYNK